MGSKTLSPSTVSAMGFDRAILDFHLTWRGILVNAQESQEKRNVKKSYCWGLMFRSWSVTQIKGRFRPGATLPSALTRDAKDGTDHLSNRCCKDAQDAPQALGRP